jgi:hypothetical protein
MKGKQSAVETDEHKPVVESAKKFRPSPNVIYQPRLHRGCNSVGLMNAGEIVPRHVEVNGGFKM